MKAYQMRYGYGTRKVHSTYWFIQVIFWTVKDPRKDVFVRNRKYLLGQERHIADL